MSPVSRLVAVCVSVTLTAIATSAMRAAAAAAGSSVQHRIVSGCVGECSGKILVQSVAVEYRNCKVLQCTNTAGGPMLILSLPDPI